MLLQFCFYGAIAQTENSARNINLEKAFNRLALSHDDSEKRLINDTIIIGVEQYMKSDSVFYSRFENIKFLGQIMSPDSLVKILTWNIAFSDGNQNYYCYFLTKPVAKAEIEVYKLTGTSGTAMIRKDTTYTIPDWYGTLYYDLRPFYLNNEKYYVLLGIDFKDIFLSRKIIEIVKVEDGNVLIFGKRCIVNGTNIYYREVFEYSSLANMTLRFKSDNEIIFDHLSPFSPEYKDNFQYYGPDFSYDSYVFEKEQWKLKEDVDLRNIE